MLKIEGLTKSYSSEHISLQVLNNISFSVDEGEFVAVMGRSGCGKTTLLNILGMIDTYDSGSYEFTGKDVAGMSSAELTHFRGNTVGIIFQSFNLLQELNCRDNISLPMGYSGASKKERDTRSLELLDEVGLPEKAKQYPSRLSGGQQQRVAIARAMANKPRLILADEPTGNLDYQNGLDIMRLLKKMNEAGVSIVMVTHDEEFSRFAGRVLQMKDGVFVS